MKATPKAILIFILYSILGIVIIYLLVSIPPIEERWSRGELPPGQEVVGLWRNENGEPFSQVCIQIGDRVYEYSLKIAVNQIDPPIMWIEIPGGE